MVSPWLGILSYGVVIHKREESSSGSTPKVIGLTGGIGAGKSSVARILHDHGCVVFDADEAVRGILKTDSAVREKLISWWGSGIINDEGKVDRRRVAQFVFVEDGERKRLEGLLHPMVEKRRNQLWEDAGREAKQAGRRIAAFVIDAPLLFEVGLDKKCDAVIFVDASEEIRLNRVREGRGWRAEELKNRERAQWSVDMKREKSDFIVENEGSFDDLRSEVRVVLEKIVAGVGGKGFA